MSLDLNNPDAWPAYRPLLHDLAELWLPPEPATMPTTTPPTLATPTTTGAASDIVGLQVQVDDLRARMARLEASRTPPPPSPPSPPKAPYVDVPQATVDARWNVWIVVPMRDPRYTPLPPSVAQDQFARHNGLSVREFRRWFSVHRTHAPGSPQDLKYWLRIREALERLPEPCITD
jgi:hypothetical protein